MRKVRLSVDCTENERMYIKMLAAKEKKTISEYLLSLARNRMPKKGRSKVPNKKTQNVLKETEEGENLETHENLNGFWESMGINPHAED